MKSWIGEEEEKMINLLSNLLLFDFRERVEKEKALALQRALEKAAREKERRELEEKRKALEEKRKLVRHETLDIDSLSHCQCLTVSKRQAAVLCTVSFCV